YVRLVRPHAAAAPSPAAPTARTVVPPRGVVPPPPPRGLPGLYVPPAPPRTFHRARALLRHRRTPLRRMSSRRGGRSLHVERSFNTSRLSWDVSEQCHDACGRSYVDVAARSSLAASSWRLWAPGPS